MRNVVRIGHCLRRDPAVTTPLGTYDIPVAPQRVVVIDSGSIWNRLWRWSFR
ncbi:hypothetical protein GS935_26050 [Rhodococcus hoagii]|nr:hypothetical protein [Prescottella equi]